MLSNLSKRQARRVVVVEFSPFQILALELSQPHHGPVVVDSAAEFNRDDTVGLDRWLQAKANVWQARLIVIVGLVPQRGIVQRESVHPRRLTNPDYLADVVEEQQKGRFLSATPFKVVNSDAWTLRAVNALDGAVIPPDNTPRPALICGIANDELQEVQKRFVDQRLRPDRIEPGLLSLFGLVYDTMSRRGDARATAIIVIHQTVTAAYILGKEGVHTPGPVLQGFASILDQARKELGGKDAAEAKIQLENADPVVINLGVKLVRQLGRDLKPVVDSYEMTTGQPVDEILCAYLPPKLSWLAEPLGHVVGRTAVAIDCNEWLSSAGIQVAEGSPAFGPHWMGALSLVGKVADIGELKAESAGTDDTGQRPWHVDCRLPGFSDDHTFATRRFLTGTVVGALLVLVATITFWQVYATNSLSADTIYWERQMADNRKLFDELTAANAKMKKQTGILDSAYELMATPYQLTDLILNLGRTIPARMRVERIETSDTRVAISGSLLEPAEEASGTLGQFVETLRRNPGIGPLFSSIAITSMQRKANSDSVVFEITLRLKRVLP